MTAYVGMRRKIALFFVFWFAFFITMQAGLLLGLVGGRAPETFPGIWWPGALVAVGAVAYLFSRSAAVRDADYVLSFLRHSLQAESESPDGATGEVTRP